MTRHIALSRHWLGVSIPRLVWVLRVLLIVDDAGANMLCCSFPRCAGGFGPWWIDRVSAKADSAAWCSSEERKNLWHFMTMRHVISYSPIGRAAYFLNMDHANACCFCAIVWGNLLEKKRESSKAERKCSNRVWKSRSCFWERSCRWTGSNEGKRRTETRDCLQGKVQQWGSSFYTCYTWKNPTRRRLHTKGQDPAFASVSILYSGYIPLVHRRGSSPTNY